MTHNTKLIFALLAASGWASHAQAAVPVEMKTLTPSIAPVVEETSNTNDADQTSTLWKLYQQVQQLEQEVRLLRGRAESQEAQLEKTDKDLKSKFTDLDQRFGQLQTQVQVSSTTQVEPAPDQPSTLSSSSNQSASSTASDVTPAATAATSTKPNITSPAPSTTDADKKAYVGAYEAYKKGGAVAAIGPMKGFITNYSTSVYVPNAHYWLGEFYLATTPPDFANAKQSFKTVMDQYPKSAKAAAAIYRLATLADVDKQPVEAKRLMSLLVKQYSGTQEAQYAATFLKSNNKK